MTAPALDPTTLGDAGAVYAAARRIYRPVARRGAVEWAETERVLSAEASAEAGRYSLDRTPWWRDVLAAFADETTEEILVAKSSQVGYTELLNTFIGWVMAEDPSSMLMIQPTVEMAEAWSKERLAPMLRDTPALAGILRAETRGMARSSDDTLRRKAFPGGWLAILGANSPASLASRPVRRVIGDERDRWPVSAGAEGDPMELARRRTITFWNRKIIEGGTPTEEDASPTWAKWLTSTRERWHVPCPHCGTVQPLVWKDAEGTYRIIADRDAEGRLVPETAAYLCDQGCVIEERDKGAMVAAGRWVAETAGARVRGFHVWAAYSPWMSWAEILREFEAARGSEPLLRVFVNTILGLPFAPAAEKLDPDKLAARVEAFGDPALPPPWVGLLTAGVDVQGSRLEYVVIGWGDGERAVILEYGQVEGDPGQPETWAALTRELARPRGDLRVTAVAADTGYRPETVWAWADGRLPFRLFPVKGQDGRGRLLIQKPGAVTHKRTRRPWLVGTDTAKDALAARLRSVPDGPQGLRFADALPPEFFQHLTAEKLVTVYVGHRPTRRWQLMAGRRNEGLDCTVYALAALHGLGTHVVGQLAALVARRSAGRAPLAAPEAQPAAVGVQAPTRPQPRRGGFANRWR